MKGEGTLPKFNIASYKTRLILSAKLAAILQETRTTLQLSVIPVFLHASKVFPRCNKGICL